MSAFSLSGILSFLSASRRNMVRIGSYRIMLYPENILREIQSIFYYHYKEQDHCEQIFLGVQNMIISVSHTCMYIPLAYITYSIWWGKLFPCCNVLLA